MATTTKLIASSTMEGPQILSLIKEEQKYQLRVTKEMIQFINTNGFNPLVDKTKIMEVAMKLLPQNEKEEIALKFFMKAKKQSIKKAKKNGYNYHIFNNGAKAINFKPKSFDQIVKESKVQQLLNIKKKAAALEKATA